MKKKKNNLRNEKENKQVTVFLGVKKERKWLNKQRALRECKPSPRQFTLCIYFKWIVFYLAYRILGLFVDVDVVVVRLLLYKGNLRSL